jgi:hypothetical protein
MIAATTLICPPPSWAGAHRVLLLHSCRNQRAPSWRARNEPTLDERRQPRPTRMTLYEPLQCRRPKPLAFAHGLGRSGRLDLSLVG